MRNLTVPQISWYVFSLLAIAVLGAINLNLPFLADQSVVLTGANVIERGGALYVDFWDNKMPALFWFYWLAGKLFGFNEVGIHLFELFWLLCFSLAMMYVLRKAYSYPWLSAGAPLAVVGTYYATAGPNQLTLPEFVVCFPLFLCAWFAAMGGQGSASLRRVFFISGLFAGVSVIFKLVFAPICVAFWLVAFCFLFFRENKPINSIIRDAFLPVCLGVGIILAIVAFKFWLDDGLAELLWTAFVYPSAALETSPAAGKQRLLVSSMLTTSVFAVWTIPIVISLYHWWKVEKDIFTTILISWLVVGLLVILVQRFSWWGYHFFLIFPPLGLLGVKAIDIVTKYFCDNDGKPISALLVSALLTFVLISPLATIVNTKLERVLVYLVFEKKPVEKYRSLVRADYNVAYASTRFLKNKDALQGDIIVFGDPLYYYLSNRYPAIPMIGWPWEYFLQSQWLALPEQITTASPPYIFIADREDKMMNERKGGVKELIYARYVALHRSPEGTWFQIKRKFREQEQSTQVARPH